MRPRLHALKGKTPQEISDALKDIELKQGLIFGTHRIEKDYVLPEAVRDRMRDFIACIEKVLNGYVPTPEEAIDIMRRGENVFDEVCTCLEELDKDGALFSDEKEHLKKKVMLALYSIVYAMKKAVLIPILSDPERRAGLMERGRLLPHGDPARDLILSFEGGDVFLPLDAISLLAPDLINMGKVTEQELHKIRHDLAYEESVELEKAEGTAEADMPTQRQKDYIRYRLGEGVGDNEK